MAAKSPFTSEGGAHGYGGDVSACEVSHSVNTFQDFCTIDYA
jgi:hypothetical protein